MHNAFRESKSKIEPKRKPEPKGSDKPKAKGEDRKPGELPDHRIPIYDHAGNMRGHVSHAASQATVARFLGRHGADLTTKDGRHAWVGHKPPPPPPPPTIIMGDGSAPPGRDAADPAQSKGSAKPKPGSKPPKGLPK